MAVALGAFFYVVTHWIDLQSTWQLAAAVLVVFALIALTFDLWVYRPLNWLIRRARQSLGGNYERNDPYYRDETRQLGHLVGTRYTGLGLPAEANITISVGVATCPRDATELDALMELADKALYRAKTARRDQVVLHGAEQRERVRNWRAPPEAAARDPSPTR